jgi:glutamate racemase
MAKHHLPIGVFDSGMGGLTVLRAMREALPYESFIYLGDTARLPYGTKSPETVKQYAVQMAKVLVERNIKVLVVACNTATTAALPHLQSMLPDIPVLGVVAPGAKAAVAASKNHHIAVLATETTIAAKAYHNLIKASLPKASIKSQACALLVALAEEGMVDNEIARSTLKHYLKGFKDEDTYVLGCTHFPVFKPLLATLLPASAQIVDSAEETAKALKQLLTETNLTNGTQPKSPMKYLVTDSCKRFQTVGELFLGHPIDKHHIQLVDV